MTTKDVPAVSAGYREQLASAIRARSQQNEDAIFDEFIKDRQFAPVDPERGVLARKLAHKAILALTRAALIIALLLAFHAVPAHAALPDESAAPMADSAGKTCSDRQMAAFLVVTEANAQPVQAQVAVLQIIKREADSRAMTICELARFTGFVAPFRYAQAHSESWTARQWGREPEWAYGLAEAVLLNQLPDARGGAMHFDGRAHDNDMFVIGDTHFQP